MAVILDHVDPRDEAAQYCLVSYFAELERRSGTRLEPATLAAAQPDELLPPKGAMVVAFLRGEPVGCGAVKLHPGAPCEIKRMWVAESARGAGIGWRLLERLEEFARAYGATAARLETNATLVEAIAMYKRAGYVEVDPFNDEPFADHWFEKAL